MNSNSITNRFKRYFGLGVKTLKRELSLITHKNDKYYMFNGWLFSRRYAETYINERENWKTEYIHKSGIKNKIILDIGAGCGESAKFFLDNGAKFVLCVEPDSSAYNFLCFNSQYNNIRAFHGFFKPEDLFDLDYDIVKIDIEGYEQLIVNDDYFLKTFNKDIILESHTTYITDVLVTKGFYRITEPNEDRNIKTEVTVLHRDKKL